MCHIQVGLSSRQKSWILFPSNRLDSLPVKKQALFPLSDLPQALFFGPKGRSWICGTCPYREIFVFVCFREGSSFVPTLDIAAGAFFLDKCPAAPRAPQPQGSRPNPEFKSSVCTPNSPVSLYITYTHAPTESLFPHKVRMDV